MKKEVLNMPTLGDNIRAKRIALGMSADDLAKRLNKSRATIYRYENSDADNMPVSILAPLAAALNTTPADLMGWNTGSPSVSTSMTFTSDSPLHTLTQAYLRRPQAVQDEIIHRLEGLDTTFSQNVSKLLATSKDYNGFMEYTKLSQQTFASLLTGTPAQITPDEAESIAAFFGVDVVGLFFNCEDKVPSEPQKTQKKKPGPPIESEPKQPLRLSDHCKSIYQRIKQRAKKEPLIMIRLKDYKKILFDIRVAKFITDTINAIEEKQSQYMDIFDPRPAYKVIANEIISTDFVETYVNGGDAGMEDLIDTILNKFR